MGQKQQWDTVSSMVKEGKQRNLSKGYQKSHDPVLCHGQMMRQWEQYWDTPSTR